jgi:hypothetical protein
LWAKLLIVFVLAALTFTGLEVLGRFLQVDWTWRARGLKSIPVYYRIPTVPVCGAFFRRLGPDSWTGNVLSTGFEKTTGQRDTFYRNEQPITVSYDNDGFRNPADLQDWDVAVAGDSFTELGYLPDDDLFTTQLGKLLNVRVKNLGVSFTGPLTQTCYLRNFGKSPSTKIGMLVFYEGNDLDDLDREWALRARYEATGRTESRSVRQSSLLDALIGLVYRPKQIQPTPSNMAYYDDTLITLDHIPRELSAERAAKLHAALHEWATTARALKLEPWLAYMPCKLRILHPRLRFTADTDREFVNWQPNNLPQTITELAKSEGLSVVDTTPALLQASESGVLTYNRVWETHINRAGSHIVAQVLAEALRNHTPTVNPTK